MKAAATWLRVSTDEQSTEKSFGGSLWISPSAGPIPATRGIRKVFVGGASAINSPHSVRTQVGAEK